MPREPDVLGVLRARKDTRGRGAAPAAVHAGACGQGETQDHMHAWNRLPLGLAETRCVDGESTQRIAIHCFEEGGGFEISYLRPNPRKLQGPEEVQLQLAKWEKDDSLSRLHHESESESEIFDRRDMRYACCNTLRGSEVAATGRAS